MFSNTFNNLKALFLPVLAVCMVMTSCLKDDDITDDPNTDAARARIEITDAPIDDANVKGVFVTVVDIMVDGKSWAGFDGKTTFDLLAYQKGQTKLLGEGELSAKTYSEIVLVLDTETDANGNSPGCYVLDANSTKQKLAGGSTMNVKVKGSFATTTGNTTEAVVDFDLRKSIIYKSGSTTEFAFVTSPELQTSVRLMDKSKTGTITGDFTDGLSGSDKVIVYAYKKGEYNVSAEKFPQGTSDIQFKNAITSSVVGEDGSFNFSFLENGTYELHFISYQEDADGKLEAKGELQNNIVGSTLSLLGLSLAASATIDVDVVVTGIIFF